MVNWHLILWGGGAVAFAALIGGGWFLCLPRATAVEAAPVIVPEESIATIAALRPPKRQRPLIAVIGINNATEVTDYLMPYGILRRAD